MSFEAMPDAVKQELKATELKNLQKNSDYQTKIEKIQSVLQQKKLRTGKLDCAIVMDLTASMDSYIKKMKLQLCNLIADINKSNKDLNICFAFVGYKDFCDDREVQLEQSTQIFSNLIQKQQLESKKLVTGHLSIQDFSSDLENFQEFLKTMFVSGGGDIPEDVAGALYQSLKLSWRTDSFKIVVLVSDAPTHGTQYHTSCLPDNYSNGHPFGIVLEDVVLSYAKMNAMFLIFKLNDSTEKMFQIIKEQMKSRQAKTRFIDLQQVFKRKEDKILKKNKTRKTKTKYIADEEEVYFSDDADTKTLRAQFREIKMRTDIPYFFKKKKKINKDIKISALSDLEIREDESNYEKSIEEDEKDCSSVASYVNAQIADKINYDSQCEMLSFCQKFD